MTIEVVNFTDTKTLFSNLEALALDRRDVLFRGHRDASWEVASTLSRYTTMPLRSYAPDLEDNLLFFMYKMKSLGQIPFSKLERRAVLEFARHHGIPTPVIDFSWSPYVAAYFAFSSIQWKHGSPPQDAAIISVDMQKLGQGWVRTFGLPPSEYDKFMHEDDDFFGRGYPADVLKFMYFPASWNTRMQRQQGSFLYDAIDYAGTGAFRSLEDFIRSIDEPTDATTGTKLPTMTKFLAPHNIVGDVLARLEMTNVSGSNLLDHEGVAVDVMSGYNHNRKIGYTWDMIFE
ncbi:FRG domain-containing protein [Methylobacterium sp. WL116]|uniref:FRG domain-containing protein n=1 Tax=Methylobacterium sp. WL116 TaxID=2603889 RepID=UPI0011D6971A|nr:FRG domain-containing protein [Methylobacterium sp. WL116]TXM94662.1 FRG domain-containing protein [Methylobacterium sp. WL116]